MVRIKSLVLVLALTVISCSSEAGASTNPQRQKIQSTIRTNLVVQRLDARQYCERGWEKYSAGDFQGAIDNFTEAIRLKPDSISVYRGRADAKNNMGDYQGATADLQKVSEIIDNQVAQSTDAERYVIRGAEKAQLLVGDYQGAIADFTEAIRLEPDLAEAYSNRGKVKLELRDSQGAIDDTTEAIRLKPDLAEAYDTRSSAKSQLGDLQGSSVDGGKFEKFRYCQFNGDMPKPTQNARQTNTTQNARQTNTTPNTRQANTTPNTRQANTTSNTRQANTTSNTRQATPSNPIAQGDGVINSPSTIAAINPPITSNSVTQWKVEGLGLVTRVSTPPANKSEYIDINRRVAFNAIGMTEEQALDRLSRIPIFTIVDDKDVPLVSNQITQLVPFYLSFSDASHNSNPVPDRKGRIIVRTMRDAFQIIRQNQNNKKIDFKFIADRHSKGFASFLLRSQRIEGEIPDVPVFYAIYGEGNKQNLLIMSIKENGKIYQTIPFFFEYGDLLELIRRISKVQPEIKKNTKIQFASLFHILDLMQTKDNNFPETESFRFVPSSVALEKMLKMQK